jgi:LysM repeat protein
VPTSHVASQPFGHGVVALTTIANHNCDLYNIAKPSAPVLVREMMQDSGPCARMQWRAVPTPAGPEYQLLTWSTSDEHLRFWFIDAAEQEKLGFSPSDALRKVTVDREQKRMAELEKTSAPVSPRGGETAASPSHGNPSEPSSPVKGSPLPTDEHTSPSTRGRAARGSVSFSGGQQGAPRQLTLEQEWAYLRRNPPAGITVEKTHKADRSLLVTAQHGPYMVQVRVTFPAMYPNAAPPSFQVLSNLSPHSVVKTKEAMVDCSQDLIDQNMNCLEPCFKKLMEMLKQESAQLVGVGGGIGTMPTLMQGGQLMSPFSRLSSPLPRSDKPTSLTSPSQADLPAGCTTYIVKPADSLAAIALMFKMTVGELRKLNNIHHSAQLLPGAVLTVKAPVNSGPVTPNRRKSISQANSPVMPVHHAQSTPLRVPDAHHSSTSPASPTSPTRVLDRGRAGTLRSERMLVKKISFSRDDIAVGGTSASPEAAVIGSVGSTGSDRSLLGSPTGSQIAGTPPAKSGLIPVRRARNSPRLAMPIKGIEEANVVLHLRGKYVDMTEEPPAFVTGVLTLTESQLIFEPELDDPQVQKRGLRHYTLSAEMSTILHAEALKPTDLSFSKDMSEMFLQILSKEKHHGTGSNILLFVANSEAKVQEWSKLISQRISQSKEKNLMASLNLDSYLTKLPSLKGANAVGTPRDKRAGSGSNQQVGSSGSSGGLLSMVGKAAIQFGKTVAAAVPALPKPTLEPAKPASVGKISPASVDLDDDDMPHLLDQSNIIDNKHVAQLSSHLPLRQRFSNWKLKFSTEQHGTSLITFFAKVKGESPTLIIIKDSDGYVFGGFASEAWEPKRGYFGTGECFLFSLEPSLAVYTWTKADSYFMFARRDCIAMGGQGTSGRNGFWLDSEFNFGTSEVCKTFLNRRLSAAEEFKCTVVEVWSFVSP